jgi:hypothetical protein
MLFLMEKVTLQRVFWALDATSVKHLFIYLAVPYNSV